MKEFAITKDQIAPDGPAPVEGDKVEFPVSATVSRVDGVNFFLKDVLVNGVPMGEQAPPEEPSEEDLMSSAANFDKREEGDL